MKERDPIVNLVKEKVTGITEVFLCFQAVVYFLSFFTLTMGLIALDLEGLSDKVSRGLKKIILSILLENVVNVLFKDKYYLKWQYF